MSTLGYHTESQNRLQQCWLAFVIALVLVLGLGAYAWISHWLAEPLVAVPLTLCALALIGIPLVLCRQLHLARQDRDKALAQANAAQWHMSDVLRKQDLRVEQYVSRCVQELKKEIADLHIRELLLKEQAHHDGLTGLANRLLLTDRFHFAVERAKRGGKPFALLMIDLDDFKTVNDNHGHAAGDAVLVTMARRLVGAVRASDTVARLGGDEFVLIIESFEDPHELVQISEKLMGTLADAITLDTGVVVNVGASVGLALYPHDGAAMNDLLFVADQAMYECKSSGPMGLH